ncbi:hypothetical protein ACFL5S_01890 [Fibrobacterota bacterium]
MKVINGELTATKGAELLGMSRKTYYKWEERFMESMLNSMEDREPGRPARAVDVDKEAMKKQLKDQADQILTLRMGIRVREEMMKTPEFLEMTEDSKKSKKKRKGKRL